MSVRLGCLLFLLGLFSLPAPAAVREFVRSCERDLPPPVFKVERIDSGYTVDHRLASSALTSLGASARRHGRTHVLGLTRAETAATVRIHLARFLDRASGEECVSPAILVRVGYKPMKVYIGREFPVGSCSYQEILQHELRHVQAYREHLPEVETAVRTQVEQHFYDTILYGERGRLESELQYQVNAFWLPFVDSEIHKVEETQARIDSVEEYERMEHVCGGEVQRLMRAGN